MKKIIDQIGAGRVLVSDGAWGTFLQARGLKPGECPELWCLDHRDVVLDIARSYVDAGADMIETNTFGGTRFKLDLYGLGPKTAEINRAGAEISRDAAGPDRHVIASIGPTGKMLPAGEVTPEEVYESFREQAVAIEQGGADACCIETMMDPEEAALAVRAVRENTALEVLCTFTFQKTVRDEFRTLMGTSPADAARSAAEAGAAVIGANCGNGMEQMPQIITEMRSAVPGTPVIVQANAGMPVSVDGKDVFPENPEQMAGWIPDVIAAGASIVGGCCGTTPAHIAAIVQAVRRLRGK